MEDYADRAKRSLWMTWFWFAVTVVCIIIGTYDFRAGFPPAILTGLVTVAMYWVYRENAKMVPDPKKMITFSYTNYRGEVAVRKAIFVRMRWGKTTWHPEPGYLVKGLDVEKNEYREFALKDCDFTINNEGREVLSPEDFNAAAERHG